MTNSLYGCMCVLQPKPEDDTMRTLFQKHSGGDDRVDAEELRRALNDIFVNGR